MQKITLSKQQIEELVWNDKYKIDNREKASNLDEFSVIISASENFGFDVDKEKTKAILKKELSYEGSNEDTFFNGAILQIRGNYSVKPTFSISTDDGDLNGNLFVFHETIANQIHRKISDKLIKNKAVKLFPGTDEEYLYEVLSESTEEQLYETLKKLALDLPIYLVEFKDDGSFKVKEVGKV